MVSYQDNLSDGFYLKKSRLNKRYLLQVVFFERWQGTLSFPSFLPPEQIEHFNLFYMLKFRFDIGINPLYYEYGKNGKRQGGLFYYNAFQGKVKTL